MPNARVTTLESLAAQMSSGTPYGRLLAILLALLLICLWAGPLAAQPSDSGGASPSDSGDASGSQAAEEEEQASEDEGDAEAETPQRVSDEITVTARLVEEALTDVPATVSVLTDAQIEAVGIERAEDFVKLVPGVSMVNAAEVGDTQVNIRGINGSRDAENSFAFIVDGILMTNPAAFNREFANLRQIEVLKGPQGALYGRNAAAGAVIVTTRPPNETFDGEVRFSAAEDSSFDGSLRLGGGLGTGTANRYQFQADWRDTNGFYENVFQNRDDVVDDFESFNLKGRLLLQPNDRTTWDLKARYGEVTAAAITFNAAFALPSFASVLGTPEFFEDVNDHDFVFQGNIDPRNDQESLELSVKLDRTLDFGSLTAWLLYSDIENELLADGTSGAFGFFNTEQTCIDTTAALFGAGVLLPPPQFLAPTPGASIFGPYSPTTCDGTQFQLRNQEDLSLEVRLAGEANDRLRWQAGAYYLNIDREVGVNLGIDLGQGVVPELFVPQDGANPTEQLVHDSFETDVAAIFGALHYDASDAVSLSLALRYDREERSVRNLVPVDARSQFVDFSLDGQFTGNAPLNPGLDPILNPGGILPQSETFDEIQPKASISWRANDAVTFFGSWGVGFKSGGFNNQGSNATVELFYNTLLGTDLLIEDQFNEETSSAFEFGFKANVTDDFYIEGAAYQTDVDDMQFFEFLVGPFGLLRVVSNIDEVQIRGAELGLNWSINNYLTLRAGYNFTDSEIERNSSRPATIGNESPYTPKYTGDLSLEFSRPISDRWVFQASGYLTAIGETWFHTVQDEERVSLFDALFPGLGTADYSLTQRDSHQLIDARIGISNENWTFTLFGSNLGDEEFLEEVITAPEFGGSFIHPGSQRRVGVELAYRF